MRPLLVIALVGCVHPAAAVYAQADFGGLHLKPGDVIYVTDLSGAHVSGMLTDLSRNSLSVDGRTFQPAAGLKIERSGDPVWDGAVIGAGIGLLVGPLLAGGECTVNRPAWKCALAYAGWGAAIGAFVDFRHAGRTRIFVGTADAPSSREPIAQQVYMTLRLSF